MAIISVIVPVYKVEPYLKKCIESILSQSFQDFDLVLVDDGSPDRCPAICDAYAETDKRITVIHKKNGGLSDARNAGIDWAMAQSESQWLAFVDSDDYLHPDYLSTLYSTAQKESAELVICDFQRVSDDEEALEDSSVFYGLTTSDKTVIFKYLDRNWRIVPAWNKLYAKKIFQDLRFAFRKIHEDEFAIHHVLWNSERTSMIDRKLYYYRCRNNSIMATESSSSRIDGLEAAVLQFDFCLQHNLPPRHFVSSAEYLDFVMDLRRDLTRKELTRYYDLKRRYKQVFFADKRNHSLKAFLLFHFNALCRAARSLYQKLIKKR